MLTELADLEMEENIVSDLLIPNVFMGSLDRVLRGETIHFV